VVVWDDEVYVFVCVYLEVFLVFGYVLYVVGLDIGGVDDCACLNLLCRIGFDVMYYCFDDVVGFV